MVDGILLVTLRFLEVARVPLLQPDPLYLLLEKTKGAAAAGTPFVVSRQSQAGAFQYIQHPAFVDAGVFQRQPDDEVVVRGRVSFPVLFISPNRDIAVHGVAIVKARPDPLLEGAQLQLAGAPARLRRRQEVVVLLQPEVEVPVGFNRTIGLPRNPSSMTRNS